MIVLTVAMLTSINVIETKAIVKKSIRDCIKAAKCEETLKKELTDNGHEKIAETFKDVKCEKTAQEAVAKLGFVEKLAVIKACTQEKEHLQKIFQKAKK